VHSCCQILCILIYRKLCSSIYRLQEIKKNENNELFNFSDLLSSHCMRRTAITILLRLGVPERVVRDISGHTANSQSFHKYVEFSQSFIDSNIDKAFEKLKITY
jgi:intergrase/recombinase